MQYQQLLATAAQLQRAGRFAEAEAAARRAHDAAPTEPDAVYLLGLVLLQQRRNEDAATFLRRAIHLRPTAPEYHANLGHALRTLGRLDDAADALERAVQLKPDYAIAHTNLGSVRRMQGRLDEAIASFQRAVQLQPNLFAAWMNLGNGLRDLGKPDDALAAYQRAIAIDPANPDAHGSAATMLGGLNRIDDAVKSFQAALSRNARHLPTLLNFGNLLRNQSDFDGAIRMFRNALSVDPSNPDAHERLGRALMATCQPDEAIKHYERALQIAPTPKLRLTYATLIPPVYRSIDDVNFWRARIEREMDALHRDGFKFDITRDPPPSIVYLPYQGLDDRELAERIMGLCALAPSPRTRGEGRGEGVEPSGSTSSSAAADDAITRRPLSPALPPSTGGGSKKVRIGFVSSLFKDQTVGLWMQGLIATLDRSKFEVTVISTAAHDDATGRFIREHADRYIVLSAQLPIARDEIAALNQDVLIYSDIGMDPWTAGLAFARLAPVQCVTIGHPITSAIPTIDYFISNDLAEAEDGQRHYTEKLIRPKHLPVYYYRPAAPTKQYTRGEFDLPADANLYGCLQAQYKLHPSFDPAIAGILRTDPNGLVLLSRGGTARGEDVIRRRIASSFPDIIDRVRFMPALSRDAFRGLTSLCAVLLAPFPFGAGDSSMEGFALNLPTVTLPTPYLKGRLTYAMYQLMRIEDCIAKDLHDYVQIATRLGTDRAYNDSIQAKIAAANHVLYENPAGVREIEEFIIEAVNR